LNWAAAKIKQGEARLDRYRPHGFRDGQAARKAGCDITVWNRTRAKAEPLAKDGAKIVGSLPELAPCDIVFCMVSTYDDVREVIAGPKGLLSASAKPG